MAVVLPDPLFANQQKRKRNTPQDTSQSSSRGLLATSAVAAVPFVVLPFPPTPVRRKRIYSETSQSSSEVLDFAYDNIASVSLEMQPAPYRRRTLYNTSTGTPLVLYASSPTITGTLATTNANDTSAAAGTTTILGALAKTNANDTSAGAGTTTVLGTLAKTNANDTSAAAGTTTVLGSLATTNTNDTLAASGAVGGTVTGTLATTNANDTSAGAGTTTVLGSLARTNANDTSSAAGTTTVLGSLATTNANDTLAANGAAGTVTGTLATTNANDTLHADGTAGFPAPPQQFYRKITPRPKRRVLPSRVEAEQLVEAAFTEPDPIEIEVASAPLPESDFDQRASQVAAEIAALAKLLAKKERAVLKQIADDEDEDILKYL